MTVGSNSYSSSVSVWMECEISPIKLRKRFAGLKIHTCSIGMGVLMNPAPAITGDLHPKPWCRQNIKHGTVVIISAYRGFRKREGKRGVHM